MNDVRTRYILEAWECIFHAIYTGGTLGDANKGMSMLMAAGVIQSTTWDPRPFYDGHVVLPNQPLITESRTFLLELIDNYHLKSINRGPSNTKITRI